MALAMRKLRICCWASAIVAIGLMHFAGPAMAQETAGEPIPIAAVAVVDMERIFKNAKASSSARCTIAIAFPAVPR